MQHAAIQREIARAKRIIDRLNDYPSRQVIAKYIAELEACLPRVKSFEPQIVI